MDDLVQFLRDRLDEDERSARAAMWEGDTGAWTASPHRANHKTHMTWDCHGAVVASVTPENADADSASRHIARHDPARVLREVEAKRGVLNQYEDVREQVRNPVSAENRHAARIEQGALGDVMRLLALPYADHPDYRSEWAS